MALLWPYLFFILLSLCAFWNTLGHPFVHDEIAFIVQNPNIGRWDDVWNIFFSAPSIPIDGMNTYFRPVLELLYRFEYLLFGFKPFGWHLFNVLLHGINAALLWRLLGLIGFSRSISLAVAILFTVHPIQTEAVACVAGVSNLMMALFVFLALIAYLRNKKIALVLYLALAIMTKEQSIIIVPLIVLFDVYRKRYVPGAWGIMAAVTLFILTWRQSLTTSNILGDIFASMGELKLRLLTIAQVLLTDIRLLFFPYDLHYYRSTDILSVHWPWWVALGILLLILIRLRLPMVWFGFAFFVIALFPVLNIVPMVNEYSLIQSMEHFLYVPMIGIMLAVVCLITQFCRKHTEQIFLIIVICFTYLALIQNQYWSSEIVIFERTVTYQPKFARGHHLLARAYYFNGQYTDAQDHFAQSYAIMEGYARKAYGPQAKLFYNRMRKDILFDWAHNYESMGYWKLAERKYMQAIELDPYDPVLWDNIGCLYVRMGKANDAVAYFEKALTIDPNFKLARQHLNQIK